MAPVFGHGRLRLYLLKLLDEAPRHGYELIRLLEDRFLGLYAPSAGTIYPRLARLEAEGLITHEVVGGRKVYRLTDAGRAELRDRVGELDSLETEIGDSVRELAHRVGGVVGDEVRDTARDVRDEFGQTVRDLRRARAGHPAPVWASFLSYLEQRAEVRPAPPDHPGDLGDSGDLGDLGGSGSPDHPDGAGPPGQPAVPDPPEALDALGLPARPVVLEPRVAPDRPATSGEAEEFLDRLQDFRDEVRDAVRDAAREALRDEAGVSATALRECADVLSAALSRIQTILNRPD